MLYKSIAYKVYEYILAFFLILQCNSMIMASNTVLQKVFLLFTVFLLLILFFISVKRLDKLNMNVNKLKRMIKFNEFMMGYLLIFVLVEYFFVYKFHVISIMTSLITPIIFVTYFFERKQSNKLNSSLLDKIVKIVFIMEIVSLVFWIISLAGVKPNFTFFSQWNGGYVGGYYIFHFIPQYNSFLWFNNFTRNTGIFVEAPMYSYVMCVSLIIQLFIRKKKFSNFDRINLLLTIITIFSTVSTTGIIISVVSVVVKLLFLLLNHATKIGKILSTVIIICGGVLSLIIYMNKGKSSAGAYSSMVRADDIHACIHAWMDHSIWGVGINNVHYISQYVLPFRRNNLGLATGFFSILAFGGILLALYYVIPLFISLFISKETFIIAILLGILFIYTIIPFAYIFSLILSYLWFEALFTDKGEKKIELFSSRIRTLWSHLCLRSSKEG